ncbi:testis-expressed protein 43 [Amphiprion ocellaris]|uniref:testis-expressed protein 43 n=1 Tax=Amphiprion ocellaris TaxID=80972 RepID=UPI000C31099E|nr:testis-expressed protein 43 [Amphiprion ocellaris]
MAEAAEKPDQHEQTSSHVLTFSARHPMIPRLYVMPWRRDMKHQRLLMKNAALAGIPTVPLEESLCFCGRERLCHGQDSNNRSSSSSSSSSSAPLSQTLLTAHHSSHLSRFNSSVVTTRSLYQT